MTVRTLTSGNDSFVASGLLPQAIWGMEGADTIDATTTAGVTIVGGLDSADAADLLIGSRFADFIYGNGGDDNIRGNDGADTIVGGFGGDSIIAGAALLVWGNQGNDYAEVNLGTTLWAGQGNDTIGGHGTVYGNEGDDLIVTAELAAGGAGADTFRTGGGSITDLNWAEDRIDTPATITRTANVGTMGGNTFIEAARLALIASQVTAGETAAVQYDYQGRTYLTTGTSQISPTAIIDITGVIGTITTSDFI